MKNAMIILIIAMLVGCGSSPEITQSNTPTVIHDTIIVKVPIVDTITKDTVKKDTIINFTDVGDQSVVGSWLQYKYSATAGCMVPSNLWKIRSNGNYVKNSFTPCPGQNDIEATCGRYEYGTMHFENSSKTYTRYIDSIAKRTVKGGQIIVSSRTRMTLTNNYRHITVSWRPIGGLVLEGIPADSVNNAYWGIDDE